VLADEVVIQTGSFDGYLTGGYSKSLTKGWYVDSLYGFTPDPSGAIHSFTFKLRGVHRCRHDVCIGGGAKAIMTFDKDTYIILPKKYPRRYYPPTGLFFSPFFTLNTKTKKGLTGYIEISTLDYYMESFARNIEGSDIRDYMTWGAGLTYKIGD
jgi:hypothetical protein